MKENNFSSRLGFVMAVSGSAVGLGNIWRFPYLTAKYGGGIFLLTYIVLALTVGFALLISEVTIGRKTGKGPVGVFKEYLGNKGKIPGWITAIIPMLIIPYYCLIGGWVLKYFFEYVKGSGSNLVSSDYFGNFISSYSPCIFLVVFATLTMIVIFKGIQGGIENLSKILMPLLVLMAILISIYGLMSKGAIEGLKYYLVPDFSKFSIKTVIAAIGQMFYSLCIGSGVLYTYGSYMKKDADIEVSITQVEIMDTLVAFLAGLMIIPAVFSYSGGESLNAGAPLMFITMPAVFNSLPFGNIVGGVFFLLVFFAALTSSISLGECAVSTFVQECKMSRNKAMGVVFGIIIILGIPISLGFGVLDFIKPLGMSLLDLFDFITNSCMMPIAALFTVFLVKKVIGFKGIEDEIMLSSKFKKKKAYILSMNYIVTPTLIIILVSYILISIGIISL